MTVRSGILAYTAGILDGEGCVMLTKKSYNAPRVGFYVLLVVTVVNTNEWLIQWLKMQFGGMATVETPLSNNSRDIWRWTVSSSKASDFLQMILPYLQIKRPQAELAIKFQTRKNKYQRLSESERAMEEANRFLMSKYNQR